MCRPRPLDNPVRRWAAPPSRELDALALGPGMTVADLGAGVGYFVRATLDRLGASGTLHLVDIDEENLALVRRRVGDDPRVRVHVGSAAAVPEIADGTVDRVLMSLVLCCLVDKEGAMETAWRILRPGGRALVTYPRGRLPRPRRGSLRVTEERWRSLLRRRPWEVLPAPRGWVVHRHLLAKPSPGPAPAVPRTDGP